MNYIINNYKRNRGLGKIERLVDFQRNKFACILLFRNEFLCSLMVKFKYYTEELLIQKSGLSRSEFARLKELILIFPDGSNRYRASLLGWCLKLRQLLLDGWKIEVIKVWASHRSKESEHNEWPPDHDYWKEKYNQITQQGSDID